MRGGILRVKDQQWAAATICQAGGDARMRTILAVLILMAALAVPALPYSGFCLPKGRFLTDQEIIDIGARDYFQRYPPPNYAPKDGSYVEVVRPIAYESFEDFMSRNPNCCSVTLTGRDGGVHRQAQARRADLEDAVVGLISRRSRTWCARAAGTRAR